MSWDLKFLEPIAVPGRRPLVTLRDAATYITGLPKETQQELAWQSAVHVLLEAADNRGPMEFARLGMMQALQPRAAVYDSGRKAPKWGNTRKLARER